MRRELYSIKYNIHRPGIFQEYLAYAYNQKRKRKKISQKRKGIEDSNTWNLPKLDTERIY